MLLARIGQQINSEYLARLIPSYSLMRRKKNKVEISDFNSKVEQSISNGLAFITGVAIFLVICIIGRRNLSSFCILGQAKKWFWVHIGLTYRPSTLTKSNNTWTAPNATNEEEIERSSAGLIRVLVDVCYSSCSLFNLRRRTLHNSDRLNSCSLLLHGLFAWTMTSSWSLMRPRNKRLKIPIALADWVKA